MSSSFTLANCRIAVLIVVVAILSACGHEPVRRAPVSDSSARTVFSASAIERRSAGEQAAVIALRQIGVPYRYGGTTVQGFDCSGLVQYAYANAGKRIPRTTSEQWKQLTPVNGGRMRVGDLLFFRIEGRISHVGLYLGDRRFVHAPSTGRRVTVAELDSDYYRRAFVRAARP